jgi:SAM-dependent MidA family methyltransferase
VHILERSVTLKKKQERTLLGMPVPIAWWEHASDVPRAPSIVVANEFLDTFAVERQLVRTAAGWATRGVGLDDRDRLQFVTLDDFRDEDVPEALRAARKGSIFEIGGHGAAARELCHLAREAMAALFIDYGHAMPGLGETLQAVRRHRWEHPLCSPGEADLTAHVDFARFAALVGNEGLLVDGPVTQAEFLGSLGIMERASRLMAANPAKAGAIEAGVGRLMSPGGMGSRFKVMGVRNPGVPPLPGFAAAPRSAK